ncbi:MAG: glycoside hydrolase family 15 protein [Thermodesulfovibrionales bacterium]
MNNTVYPPISRYGYISDCHSSALVSISGSIDWCCMPRLDSGSCFGRILDWKKGGYCQIAPSGPYEASRRYLEDTLVLETSFRTDHGEARLLDCFPMRRGGARDPHQQILRIIEGIRGRTEFIIGIVPCFDYGTRRSWIRGYKGNHHIAIGGNDGLLISNDFVCEMTDRHSLSGSCSVEEGQRAHLSILYRRPEDLDEGIVESPSIEELDRRLDETIAWWRSWSSKNTLKGPFAGHARRSAIVLKGLSNAPTGAIVAASTTSLPESPGGSRNWDYRYTWIRDSSFTVRSLAEVGHLSEADGFRRFIERSAAGSAEELQILFGVGGERRLPEYEIKELQGYRGIKPVRVGNAAAGQRQLDIYGELLDLAWSWHSRGHSPDDDYWEFLVELVNASAESWKKPDHGIWEMRGKPRHFVLSKAMCWTALDRGIKLAGDLGRKGPVDSWKKARNEVRSAIEVKGYHAKRGVFVQAFDRMEMDAGLLLLPNTGLVDFNDERMIRTTDAVRADLEEDGLLRRYAVGNDEIRDKEGVFLACSLWLVECLARQSRLDEAHEVFKRVLSTGNELGLFSEEYDTETREMLGNFPQGLTHLSLIAAAVAITEMEARSLSVGG